MTNDFADRRDDNMEGTVRVEPGEEGVLLRRGDAPRTLLPGEYRLPADARALVLRRGEAYSGVAGAGGAPGGWASFRCEPLSPRRFASRRGEALLDGASVEALLAQIARAALADGFRGGAARGGCETWAACHSAVARALLDNGWRLTGFHPGHLRRGGEVSA